MATKQHISTVLSDLLPEKRRREDGRHRRVIRSFLDRTTISRDLSRALEDDRTFGQRIADRVAAFGGSWTFIFIFSVILLTWVVLNSVLLVRDNLDFDPFPYILLNLFLSMLAA
ncbi:MAG TPA: cyclic nucleotide-binding protein, partial [Blastocatellia bacterium]|nr:cyclic nucleotide-binding protein [Blastocatellia bacterium]